MMKTEVPIKVYLEGDMLRVRFRKDFSLVTSFVYSQEFPAWVHTQANKLGLNPGVFYLRILGAYITYCRWVALRN